MPHLLSNIPFTISYGSIFLEFFRIASCTVRNNDSLPTASDLFSGMITKGGNRAALTKKVKKAFEHCPSVFQKFSKTHEEINVSIVNNTLWWRYLKQYS